MLFILLLGILFFTMRTAQYNRQLWLQKQAELEEAIIEIRDKTQGGKDDERLG